MDLIYRSPQIASLNPALDTLALTTGLSSKKKAYCGEAPLLFGPNGYEIENHTAELE